MFEKQENVPIRVKCTKKEKCTKQIKMNQSLYQEKHSAQGSSAGALSGSQYSSSKRKNNGILYTIVCIVFAGLYLFFFCIQVIIQEPSERRNMEKQLG